MPDWSFWCALTLVSVGTSLVSGVVGMAGGMLLLAALLLGLDAVLAIPIHGVVQLVSNASRAWFQRQHIERAAVWRFALPVLPASWLGVLLTQRLPAASAQLCVGLFVLGCVHAPALFKPLTAPRGKPQAGLYWAGALVGFLSPVVGATGPLLAPFILALGLMPVGVVGTLAACQVVQHASKVLVFGVQGFDLSLVALPVLALSLAAVLGSALGARWLDRVPPHKFRRAVLWLLTLLAAQLVLDGAWRLLR